MSNNYIDSDWKPLTQARIDELVAILITCDGQGKEAKRAALDALLEDTSNHSMFMLLKHEGLE